MLKQRWKPTGPQEPTDPAGRAHDGQHDAAAGEDPGQTAKASERNRRGLRFFAGAKGELPVAVEDHGSETLIKKRWFREGERDRTGSAAVGESAAPAAGKAEGQAAADGAGSRLTADTAGSVWHEQLAPPGQEPVLTSGNFAERAGGIAQQIVKTTLQGCANLPHLVSRARAPLLMSQEYPSCVAWPSALFLVIFLAYYLSRPPRSRRRPSEFVIPSSSVFRNPERYTHLRKVSVPRLSADYVESEVEFRHPEDPANSMRQLDQWAYFPGNGWLAFLGLAPLLYVDSNSSEDHRNATAISFSSRTGGLTAEDAFDVDADILACLGPSKLLIPSDATAGDLPQLIERQLNVICQKWLALTKDDGLLDVSFKSGGLGLYAAETVGCEVTCAMVDEFAETLEATTRYSSSSSPVAVLRWDDFAGRQALDRKRALEPAKFTKCSLLCPPSTSYLTQMLPVVAAALAPRGTLLMCVSLLVEKAEGPMPPQTEAEHLRAFARHHVLPIGLDSLATGSSVSGWITLAALTRDLGGAGFELKWARSAGKDMGRVCELAVREIIPSPMWVRAPVEGRKFTGRDSGDDENESAASSDPRAGQRRRSSGGADSSRKRRSSRLSREGTHALNPASPRNARQMRKRAWEFYLAWAAGAYARGVLETYWILAVKRDDAS